MSQLKSQLRVKLTRSVIGQTDTVRQTIRGLGLHGVGSVRVVGNTPSFRGAIKKVIHLVTVEEVDGT